MSKKINVCIEWVDRNFAAHVPDLDGCVATGESPEEIEKSIKEAIEWHLESSLEDGDPIPDVFKGEYELQFLFDTQSMLKYYKGILGNTGIEKITGISNKQLNHYATGHRKPGIKTIKKIENGLKAFGRELLTVQLAQ